ncbi:MAG: hypothetical protein ACYTFK_10470 [Planctomycetota bacterium]|jgi:hypothetical protein
MTTHTLAGLVGPFEMIMLFVLLAAPVVLTVSYVIVMARFKESRLDPGMTESRILSELARLEAEATNGQNEEVSTSTRYEGEGLSYALQSE